METTLIISMVTIFLTWLYVQQKRLRAYERYCMDAYRKENNNPIFFWLGNSTQQAAEGFKAFGEEINDVLKNQSEL